MTLLSPLTINPFDVIVPVVASSALFFINASSTFIVTACPVADVVAFVPPVTASA